jgi:hypothetical protein
MIANFFKINNIAMILLFSLVLYPSNLRSIIIFISGILLLVNFFKENSLINIKMLNKGAFYIIIICTLIYSTNKNYAFFQLQTVSSLVVFPIIFSLIGLKSRKEVVLHLNKFLIIYVISIFLFNVIPFIWFYLTNYSFSELLHHYKYIIIVDIGKYTIHPIYMSMHCCISILFSLYLFKRFKSNLIKILLVLIKIVLFLFLLIYARKGPILSFLIVLIIWIFFEHKKYIKYTLLFSILFVVLLAVIPSTRERFLELTKIETAKNENSSSSDIRYSIYNNTFNLIKNAPFFGYGIGDYNDELKKSLKENTPFLLKKTYNSHNQYMSFVLIGGFVLLFSFFYFYGKFFISSFLNNNVLAIVVFLYFSILMLFENILEREHGVIFFSLFVNFFGLQNYMVREKK